MVRQSCFILLFDARERLYAVRNRSGELGVPGGKQEPYDRTMWETVRREFQEEVGVRVPQPAAESGGRGRRLLYRYIEFGEAHHVLRIYYGRVGAAAAGNLPRGPLRDRRGSETDAVWLNQSQWTAGAFDDGVPVEGDVFADGEPPSADASSASAPAGASSASARADASSKSVANRKVKFRAHIARALRVYVAANATASAAATAAKN
jgi:ADP-ribose pyrophosphatase YjhB (NUDIX family)